MLKYSIFSLSIIASYFLVNASQSTNLESNNIVETNSHKLKQLFKNRKNEFTEYKPSDNSKNFLLKYFDGDKISTQVCEQQNPLCDSELPLPQLFNSASPTKTPVMAKLLVSATPSAFEVEDSSAIASTSAGKNESCVTGCSSPKESVHEAPNKLLDESSNNEDSDSETFFTPSFSDENFTDVNFLVNGPCKEPGYEAKFVQGNGIKPTLFVTGTALGHLSGVMRIFYNGNVIIDNLHVKYLHVKAYNVEIGYSITFTTNISCKNRAMVRMITCANEFILSHGRAAISDEVLDGMNSGSITLLGSARITVHADAIFENYGKIKAGGALYITGHGSFYNYGILHCDHQIVAQLSYFYSKGQIHAIGELNISASTVLIENEFQDKSEVNTCSVNTNGVLVSSDIAYINCDIQANNGIISMISLPQEGFILVNASKKLSSAWLRITSNMSELSKNINTERDLFTFQESLKPEMFTQCYWAVRQCFPQINKEQVRNDDDQLHD